MNIKKLILKEVKTEDVSKRIAIAQNPFTPEIILNSYLEDKDFNVILSIGLNSNLSKEIIDKLIDLGDTEIYYNLIKNRNIALTTQNMIDIINNSNPFMDNCSKELFKREDINLDVIKHYYSVYNHLDDVINLNIKIPGIDDFYKSINKEEYIYLNTDDKIKLNELNENELYMYCLYHQLDEFDFRYVYELNNDTIKKLIIENNDSIAIAKYLYKENNEDTNVILASQYNLPSDIFKALASDEKYIQQLCSNRNLSQNFKNKLLDLDDIGLTRILLRNESMQVDFNILSKYLKNYLDDFLNNKTVLNSEHLPFIYDYLKENNISDVKYIEKILLNTNEISIIKDILMNNKDLMYIGLLNPAFQDKFETDEIEVQDYEIPKRYYSGIFEAEPFILEEDDNIINPYKKDKKEIEALRIEIENSNLNNR